MMSVYSLYQAGFTEHQLENQFHVTKTGIIVWCIGILYPIGGWLADTRIGRYKVVHYSMLIMWIGTMLATLGELLVTNISTTNHIKTGVYVVVSIFIMIGLGGFLSNIIHLGIDQLTDASANEITSFIIWYTTTLFTSAITLHYITDCIVTENTFYIKTLVVAICLTIALCLDFLFQHILVKEQVTRRSLREIIGVTRYVIRNRQLRHDFAHDQVPSRFDIAKHLYGGPFTSQQVDNVRKFLWMLLVIAPCTLVIGAIQPIFYAEEKVYRHLNFWKETDGFKGCYKNLSLRYSDNFFALVIVVLYEFIIHPLFYRCLPKLHITSKFLVATVTLFLWILSLLALDSYVYHELKFNDTYTYEACIIVKKYNTSTLNQTWMLVPNFIRGVFSILLLPTALEFIWAQAPTSMKGLILGFGYMFVGLSTIFHTVLAAPFIVKAVSQKIPWEKASLTCELWYYILEGFIILVVIVIMAMVLKKYNRQRESSAYLYAIESEA